MPSKTKTPRSRGRTMLVAGGAGLSAVALVALLTHLDTQGSGAATDRGDSPGVSDAIPDASVRAALGDGCRQLLDHGPAKGPRTVVVLDRTGRLAEAMLPGGVLDRLEKTAVGDGDDLGSVSLVTVGGNGDDSHVVAQDAALMDPSAGSGRKERIAAGLPDCLARLEAAAPAPQVKGSDVLYALQQGARLAQAALEAGSQDVRLYWATDGEANHGLLDLRAQGFPGADPADVARRVQRSGNLPVLDGIDVELVGIGQDLPQAERTWLEDFYSDLCTAAGGSCTVSSEPLPVDSSSSDAAEVPTDPALSALRAVPGAPAGTVAIDPAAFLPDSTDLVDPGAVAQDLAPLRADLVNGVWTRAEIVGHACDDGSPPAGLKALSEARAGTIKALLIAGHPELDAAVQSSGVGADQPIPVSSDATPDQRCAAQRTVVITPR